MWFIFPQIYGLSSSSASRRYAIKSLDEGREYLADPILGLRLIECTKALLSLNDQNANKNFGHPDDLKFHSCMTLFYKVSEHDDVFNEALIQFFGGEPDLKTLEILHKKRPGGNRGVFRGLFKKS